MKTTITFLLTTGVFAVLMFSSLSKAFDLEGLDAKANMIGQCFLYGFGSAATLALGWVVRVVRG